MSLVFIDGQRQQRYMAAEGAGTEADPFKMVHVAESPQLPINIAQGLQEYLQTIENPDYTGSDQFLHSVITRAVQSGIMGYFEETEGADHFLKEAIKSGLNNNYAGVNFFTEELTQDKTYPANTFYSFGVRIISGSFGLNGIYLPSSTYTFTPPGLCKINNPLVLQVQSEVVVWGFTD